MKNLLCGTFLTMVLAKISPDAVSQQKNEIELLAVAIEAIKKSDSSKLTVRSIETFNMNERLKKALTGQIAAIVEVHSIDVFETLSEEFPELQINTISGQFMTARGSELDFLRLSGHPGIKRIEVSAHTNPKVGCPDLLEK